MTGTKTIGQLPPKTPMADALMEIEFNGGSYRVRFDDLTQSALVGYNPDGLDVIKAQITSIKETVTSIEDSIGNGIAAALSATASEQARLAAVAARGASEAAATAAGAALQGVRDSAFDADSSATAAAGFASTAESHAGEAGVSATAAAASATLALGYKGDASGFATTAEQQASQASASAAAAQAATIVAAQFGGLNYNPVFSLWPSASGSPSGWVTPANSRVSGVDSPYAVQIGQGLAALFDLAYLPRVIGGSYFVIVADLRPSGSLSNISIGLQGSIDNKSDLVFGQEWPLSTLPSEDTSTQTTFLGDVRRYRIFVDARVAAARFWRVYLYTGTATCVIDKLLLRLASPAEVAGLQAKSDAATALANIVHESEARTAADLALSQTTDTLTAQVLGMQGSGLLTIISNNATAAASATTAVGQRVDSVSVQLRQASPSLLPNGNFANGFFNWVYDPNLNHAIYDGPHGTYMDTNNPTDVARYWVADCKIEPNQDYVLSFEGIYLSGQDGAVGIQILNSDKSQLLAVSGYVAPAGWGVQQFVTVHAPPNGAFARVAIYVPANGGGLAATRFMIQAGTTPTIWRDDATIAQIQASATIASGAIADIVNNKLASYIKLSAIAGSSQASIDIVASDGSEGPFSTILFTGQKFAFTGDVVVDGSMTARVFKNAQGVDALAVVPGTINFMFFGSDGNNVRYLNPGDMVGPIAITSRIVLTSQRLTINYQTGYGGGHGGASPATFSTGFDLYYSNDGSNWNFLATLGNGASQGTVSSVGGNWVGYPGILGPVYLAVYLRCPSGSQPGYVSAFSMTGEGVLFK